MKSTSRKFDDELIRRVRDAFHQQTVPECPTADELLGGHRESDAVATDPPVSLPVQRRSSHWAPNLIAIAAVAGIAIFFFTSMVDDPTDETPQDEIVELIEPRDRDSVESVAQQDSNDEPNANAQDAPRETPSSRLLTVINVTNDFLAGRSDGPDAVVDQFHAQFGMEPSQLRSALDEFKSPAGIAAIQKGVDRKRSWLRTNEQVAFTYQFEYPQILSDLKRLVDGYFGDTLFDPVLDGLRDDVNGPQVDVRNDFFPQFEGVLILVVGIDTGSRGDTLTVVLPVQDPTKTWRLVQQLHQVEPSSFSLESYKNFELLVTAKNEKTWCIAKNCLVVGDSSHVRSIIDRLSGQ